MKKNINKINIFLCENCGKFLTKKQVLKKNKFCSTGCATSYRCKAHDPNIFLLLNINPDLLYYCIGLIFSDGNLSKEEDKITISINDLNLAKKLYEVFCDTSKRKIYATHPILKNAKTNYLIVNTNKATIRQLKEMNLIPAKSYDIEFPLIPHKYLSSFIRGVFDGDGSVYISSIYKKNEIHKKYLGISITTGSMKFAKGLQKALQTLGFTPTMVIDSRRKKEQTTMYIKLNKQREIEEFFHIIYKNNTIKSEKKYNCYVKLLQERYSLSPVG